MPRGWMESAAGSWQSNASDRPLNDSRASGHPQVSDDGREAEGEACETHRTEHGHEAPDEGAEKQVAHDACLLRGILFAQSRSAARRSIESVFIVLSPLLSLPSNAPRGRIAAQGSGLASGLKAPTIEIAVASQMIHEQVHKTLALGFVLDRAHYASQSSIMPMLEA